MSKKRGSLIGMLIGAVILVAGAATGLTRYGTAGLIWTIVGAVSLAYNAWQLIRRGGKTPPRDFPMPDPAQAEEERAAAKAALDELERQNKSGEVGYETYVRRRMEIITGSGK